MDTSTSSLIAEAFAQAPDYIQSFISSGKYEEFIERVRATENIPQEALGTVSDEILMMLLGMTEPQALPENLQNEAGLTKEQAASIVARTNRDIFAPLQEEIQKTALQIPIVTPPLQASSAPISPILPMPSVQAPFPTIVQTPIPPISAPLPVPPPRTANTSSHSKTSLHTTSSSRANDAHHGA